MTRQHFHDEVCVSVSALMEFVSEHDLWEYVNDSICDDYSKDEQVNEWLRETDNSWEEVRDTLDNIPTGYDWYWVDGWVSYYGIYDYDRDDINRIAEMIEDAMNGEWDDEPEDEDDDPISHIEEDEPFFGSPDADDDMDIEEIEFETASKNCKNELHSIGDSEFDQHLFSII